MTRGALALILTFLLATLAVAQPDSEIEGYRPAGSRTRTAAEERRFYTGPDEVQPEITRPANFARLSEVEAAEGLRELRGLVPERSLSSLLPGYEEFRAVNERLRRAAEANPGSMRLSRIGAVHGLEVNAVEFVGQPNADGTPRPRILILGGVHAGTEKAGFEAATRFVEKAAADPSLRAKFDLTVIPLVSPAALTLGTRENAAGIDINRTFAEGKWTPESRVLGEFIAKAKPFDMSLDLHTAGDPGRDGFFVIRGKKDGGLATRMMRALPAAALLDLPGAAPGEAKVGPYKLYGVGTTEIPSIESTTMDLLERNGAKYIYTFEAPTRANPELQVRMTLRFLDSALHNARAYGRFEPRAPPRDVDRLEPFRRADGTVEWKRALADRALVEAGGLAHFGLALFLKELAVVAATGDRMRIEEFFESLLTTDFYKHYGLFVVGARAGEVAYTRYLQRYVRPRFVNGLLKTNLVLAAGIALPQIVDGSFEGKTFAITLGSLGLSSAAVRAGVKGISWVRELKSTRSAGTAARVAGGATRLARLGGWVYTAAELAVVLYLAEEIDQRVNAHLDAKAAREDVALAGLELIARVNAADATPASVAEAADAYREAWTDYRNFLYRPLFEDEALLGARLERLARRAKLGADERRAALERLDAHPALRRNLERRHGSVEAYAEHLVGESEAELQRDVDRVVSSYAANRDEHLNEVYHDNARGDALLGDVPELEWLLAGAPQGAEGDPAGERPGPYARLTRWRAKASLENALADASANRLETYADEREVLDALAASLRRRGREGAADVLAARSASAALLAEADRRLVEDPTGTLDGVSAGAADRVGSLGR